MTQKFSFCRWYVKKIDYIKEGINKPKTSENNENF